MSQIYQEFLLKNKEDSLSYYLGNLIKQSQSNYYMLHLKKYVDKVLHWYRAFRITSLKDPAYPVMSLYIHLMNNHVLSTRKNEFKHAKKCGLQGSVL